MSGLSRSEQRQLEAAMNASMGVDGKKKKAEEAADAPSPAPARKKPAGKTIPGGALNKKPPPKKPVQRKKRKADSSDSSSSESDVPMQGRLDDSSDSEDDVPAPKPVPAKKRAKAAPVTDSESEFEDEFDADFYKGPDDRKWLMSLSELEREKVIADRKDKRAIALEAWQLRQAKKKQDAQPPRTNRRQVVQDQKKQAAKAALDDMENKRKQSQKKARVDDSDDEDERDKRMREKEEREREREESARKESSAKPRHKQIERDNFPMLEVDKVEEVRVSRSRIIEYLKEDFFEEFILDMFVRVHTKNQAMLAQVKGVKEGKEYEVDTGIGHEANFKTRKHLVCAHSTSIQPFPITVMSNKPLDKENVYTWCKNMSRENKDLPDEDDLQELREKSKKNWRAYHYDHDKVDEMIMQNDKRRPVNVAKDKMRLEDERDMAWEDYKTNEDDDAKEEAYKRWEKLREQVQELEEKEEEEKQKLLQVQVPGLRTINARAKVMNRTVTKESKGINLEKNHLSCRPYIRTTYWSMPTEGQEEGQQEDAAADKPATPKVAPASKAPEAKASKVNFFDEEEDTAPAVAPRKEQSVDDALARAVKTELSVKVDTSGAQNPKTKGPEEFVLPQRTVNPLKPVPSAAAAGSGKVSLSLEEYKRRREAQMQT